MVERVIVGAEIRGNAELVAQVFLHEGDLFGRRIVVGVQFTCLEPAHGSTAVFGRIEEHRVDLDVVRIVEVRVLGRLDVRVRNEFREGVGTVGDDVLRLHEVGAVGLNGGRMNGQPGLVRQLLDEVGCRCFESDISSVLSSRAFTPISSGCEFALVDLFGILDRVENGWRISRPSPAS